MALQEFRLQVRAWLEANCPASMRTPMPEKEEVWGGSRPYFWHPDAKLWLERMVAQGWTVPEWPRKYGGAGLNAEEAQLLREEMEQLGCRTPLTSFGIWMLGPVVLKYGTEAQKLEYLPSIARGEIRWCQGYSEPAAGSDLASLMTRAEIDGDDFIVNGAKIWTSYADNCDWIFCLVRTDAKAQKQQGISFILFPINQPGVRIEPIQLISGSSPFCEVFFTNVRVPRINLVGALNGGWEIAKALLTHERLAISEAVKKADVLPVESYVLPRLGRDESGTLVDKAYRDRLSTYQLDNQAFALTLEREQAVRKAGQDPGAASSIFKYHGAELNKRKYSLMMEAMGFSSLVWSGGDDATDERLVREWLRTKGNSIEGGTSEIQLNVIAKRVLGLP